MSQPNIKVLIVDDETMILNMYHTKLKNEGYEVVTAKNGAEALTKAKQIKPDVIVTDLIMPKYDGFYFLKELKKDQCLKNIPVITLTNIGNEHKRDEACRLGTLFFLVKADFVPSEVTDVIQQVANLKRSQFKDLKLKYKEAFCDYNHANA